MSKEELLNKILFQYGNQLNYQQKEKIKSLLDVTSYDKREMNIKNSIDKKKMLEYTIQKNKQKSKFIEEQQRRKLEYQKKLQELNQENINAIKLFQLNEGYTYNDLKKSYKRLAIQTHPDRPKGSNEKFQIVTKCYFKLLEKLKTEETQPDFNQLKNNSRDYWSERSQMDQQFSAGGASNNQSKIGSSSRFDVKQFNKIFEENKLYDPNEEGYEEWLKDDSNETPPQVFSDKFNLNVFNNTFDNWKDTSHSQEIIEYKEPEALVSCNKMNYTDIDNSKPGNYTKVQEKNNDLTYCDLKNAYSKNSNLVNVSKIKIKTYRNIDDYEHERNNISYEMTPQQIRDAKLKEEREHYLEQQRLQRINQNDNLHQQHYNNLHQRMIGFRN